MLLEIAVILFGNCFSVPDTTGSGIALIGIVIAFIGLIIAFIGYIKKDSK